jgi:hypothetical protein
MGPGSSGMKNSVRQLRTEWYAHIHETHDDKMPVLIPRPGCNTCYQYVEILLMERQFKD